MKNENNDDITITDDKTHRFYQSLSQRKNGDVISVDDVKMEMDLYGRCYNQFCMEMVGDRNDILIATARVLTSRGLKVSPDYTPNHDCRFELTGDRLFPANIPVFLSFIPEAVEFMQVLEAVAFIQSDDDLITDDDELEQTDLPA